LVLMLKSFLELDFDLAELLDLMEGFEP